MYHLLGRTFSEEEWESMCTRCGLCCYEKEEGVDGEVITTDRACQFLTAENACSVYDERFIHCSECGAVTPQRLLTEPELLPFECPYLQLVTHLRAELDHFTLVPELQQKATGEETKGEGATTEVSEREGALPDPTIHPWGVPAR